MNSWLEHWDHQIIETNRKLVYSGRKILVAKRNLSQTKTDEVEIFGSSSFVITKVVQLKWYHLKERGKLYSYVRQRKLITFSPN